jgi:hypothetical protein
MNGEEAEQLLMKIEEAFGLTKHDFEDGTPIYTKWGTEENYVDIENLGDHSLKISKNLGDVYIDKISTNKWVVVGKGTTLHCDDITAGEELVENFEGFLM